MSTQETHPFTCVTCQLAFASAADQRAHYSADLHRYNSKRRVANLPPVSASVFNEKVLHTRKQALQAEAADRHRCEACSKTFNSENAYADHLHSKKHREAAARPPPPPRASTSTATPDVEMSASSSSLPSELPEGDEEAVKAYVESRLATAARIPALSCLFCPRTLATLDEQLEHMHKEHGFFLPDAEYLVDREGLVEHAAEEVGVFNTCLYCGAMFGRHVNENDGQWAEVKRAQRGLEAVRKHMGDKSHCKIRWDTEAERLEWADYYDFSASYDDYEEAGWEDTDDVVEDDEDGDAIMVDTNGRPVGLPPPGPAVRLGDTEYELVLPSGKRVGHRALRHIYKMNLVPYMNGDSKQTRAARRLAGVDDRNSSALVPVAGGQGAFGRGQQVVRARNAGEARHAIKASKTFEQNKAYQKEALRVGKVGNNQKHFRDPLLQ